MLKINNAKEALDYCNEVKNDNDNKNNNCVHKEEILDILKSPDSFNKKFFGFEITADFVNGLNDPDIKMQFVYRLNDKESIKFLFTLLDKNFPNETINDDNDNEKLNPNSTDFNLNSLVNYLSIKDLAEFSSPEEIDGFTMIYCYARHELNMCKLRKELNNKIYEFFSIKEKEISNYFYQNNSLFPKIEFYEYLVSKQYEKNFGIWAAFFYNQLSSFKQTTNNLMKLNKPFRDAALRYSNKDNIISNKAGTIISAILLTIFVALFIAACILAPELNLILLPLYGVSICGYTAFTILSAREFHKEYVSNKNDKNEVSQNNIESIPKVKNENTQENDSKDQTEPQPLLGDLNQIKNQNSSNDEYSKH